MSNILIRGCPGTGKTFFARAVAYYMCKKNMTEKDAFAQNPMDDAGEIEKFVNGTAQCEFIQIHPSMEFDDIVYGLEVKASGGISLSYTESGQVGVGRLYDRNGVPIQDNGKEHVLIISSSYGLDPWTMLETVMLDDEYEVYMDELAADNKYLFHIFYDQPSVIVICIVNRS